MQALYASKIVSYAQGYQLMRAAAAEYGWKLNYGGVALMWRGGCIIRSVFLGNIKKAFDRKPNLTNLLLDPFFKKAVAKAQGPWRRVVAAAAEMGIPMPAMSSAGIEGGVLDARERVVVVSGGAADAENWVVAQSVDLSSWEAAPKRAAVFEIDADGKALGQKVSQFDMEGDSAVATWIVDGRLAAGKKRFFRIDYGQEGLGPSAEIGIEKDGPGLLGADGEGAGVCAQRRSVGLE